MSDDAYEAALKDYGFPRFARGFPRHPELDALVVAFTRGDYARVRSGAEALARAEGTDAEVAKAARTLRSHIEADPTAKLLFVATAALLAFLTVWWVLHDGPSHDDRPTPPKTIEYVK